MGSELYSRRWIRRNYKARHSCICRTHVARSKKRQNRHFILTCSHTVTRATISRLRYTAALRRVASIWSRKMFRCIDCGTVSQQLIPGKHTGNYGIDRHDFLHCLECCGKRDAANMVKTGRATLYLIQRDSIWFVTNWPGTLNIRAYVSVGRHNLAGKRYDAWFNFNGKKWHGVTYGDFTQICHCKQGV